MSHIKEKQEAEEPKRFKYAQDSITEKGYDVVIVSDSELNFVFNGSVVRMFPYTGWHTGKTIKDGRGIKSLLKQI